MSSFTLFPILFISLNLFASITPTNAFSGGQWAILANTGNNNDDGWGDRHQNGAHKCLEIPNNFTLCHGMQYKTMKLPNLLEHETLDEAIQQSQAWISLSRLHCHLHTKLFLCSLFAPICLPQLDKAIQPCQSLCQIVQEGCAARMEMYGFPWPSMLNCSQFPSDNDLCIKPPPQEQAERKFSRTVAETICKSCTQVATFENLMDNFCRSSTVLKVRLRHINATHMGIVRKMRVFKSAAIGNNQSSFSESLSSEIEPKRHRKDRSHLTNLEANSLIRLAEHGEGKCHCQFTNVEGQHISNDIGIGTFLVMASERRKMGGGGGGINAKLIVPWKQEKAFKAAIRRFKKLNCSTLGREIRESVLTQMLYKRRTASTNFVDE